MTPDRFREMEDLYHRAQTLPPEQREAFLKTGTAADASLLRAVQLLLAQDSGDGFLARPALEVAGPLPAGSDRAPWTPGDRVGPFEILGRLGAGGMGEVFRARDTRLGRDVAIKVSHEQFGARFQREARAISALNHPNICTLYDVGPNYLVMELVEGDAPRGPLPLEAALRCARQIAEALEVAHERGIVHRDLKPANIKVTPRGEVKVLDFGLAAVTRVASPDQDPTRSPTVTAAGTQPGVILGTAAYMSPEQAAGKPVDKRCDIWSFGAVLFELLTGERLFGGETVSHTLAGVLAGPIHLDRLPAATPASIRALLRRCLERDPHNRLRDIGDARIAIGTVLAGEDPPSGAAPPVRKRWSRVRRAATAVLALAAGFALWKLATLFDTPAPRVLRLAVSIPESQAFVDTSGNAALVTPDGSAIVYTGKGPRDNQIYYRRLDQFEGRALPGTDAVCCLAMDPSGDWVAYEQDMTIRKVSLRGGAPVTLASVSYAGGISWSEDGWIYSAEGVGLFRVPANGGPVQKVAVLDPALHEDSWYMPMVLPGGKEVLVYAYKKPQGRRMALIRVADGTVIELQGKAENPIGFADGLLLFGTGDGALGVTRFDPARSRSLDSLIPVIDSPYRRNSGIEAALSSRGDLVYLKASNRSRIVFLDLQGHIQQQGSEEREFHPAYLCISPDGRQVVVGELTDNVRRADLWLYEFPS
ncbi:MAG: serine/threonine protein kinase, partial [Acidobacteriota bacterium]|nr:serine/threonine protein kinase [Acidobacteriota bacterium]